MVDQDSGNLSKPATVIVQDSHTWLLRIVSTSWVLYCFENNSQKCMNLKQHNHVYIPSSKHTYQPMGAHKVSNHCTWVQFFIIIMIITQCEQYHFFNLFCMIVGQGTVWVNYHTQQLNYKFPKSTVNLLQFNHLPVDTSKKQKKLP